MTPYKQEVRYLHFYEKLPKIQDSETASTIGLKKIISDRVDRHDQRMYFFLSFPFTLMGFAVHPDKIKVLHY